MKFLILSCKTGGGHDAAANALKLEFEMMGHEAFVFDYLTLASEKVSRRVSKAYVNLVKIAPNVFGFAYKIALFISKHTKKSPVYAMNKKMAKYLKDYLEENHYDGIVMPHLFPAETITYMKKQGIKLPVSIAVATDYTCIPFWEETNCDYYIIPHSTLTGEFVKRGLEKEKLIPLGIPFSPKLLDDIAKNEARKSLNLPIGKEIALVVGGSMGAGKMIKLIKYFAKNKNNKDFLVIAICGNNKRVYNKLNKKYQDNKTFIIMKETKEMPLYLKACDIIYTKPGGLTSTEAAASRIPLVHTYPIPGCETANKAFFTHLGMSISAKKAKQLVEVGLELLSSNEAKEKMKKAQEENVDLLATQKIANFIIDKCK